MTRWGFCESLGVYDVLEQLSVDIFIEVYGRRFTHKRGPYINCYM